MCQSCFKVTAEQNAGFNDVRLPSYREFHRLNENEGEGTQEYKAGSETPNRGEHGSVDGTVEDKRATDLPEYNVPDFAYHGTVANPGEARADEEHYPESIASELADKGYDTIEELQSAVKKLAEERGFAVITKRLAKKLRDGKYQKQYLECSRGTIRETIAGDKRKRVASRFGCPCEASLCYYIRQGQWRFSIRNDSHNHVAIDDGKNITINRYRSRSQEGEVDILKMAKESRMTAAAIAIPIE